MTAVSTPQAAASQHAQPYRWIILVLTSLTFVITFLVHFSWPPLIPVVVQVLHMKMTQAGAFMSAFYTGYVITQLPASILADRFGARLILAASLIVTPLNAALGWQWAFKIAGLIAIVVGVLVFTLVKISAQSKTAQSMFAGFPLVFGNKDLLLTALAGFCLMWVELGTATWTIAHIKHHGFTLGAASSIMLAYGIGGIIGPCLSGWISDKIGHRKWILIISYALIIPVTVIFGSQTTIGALSVVGFFFGFIAYFANPHLIVMISEFVEKQCAALANGTANVIFQIAPIVGPVVLGWSIDKTEHFSVAQWMMAAGPLVGILLLLPVNEQDRKI